MSYTIESPFQYFPDPTKFGTLGLGSLYIGITDGSPYLVPAQRQQVYIAVQGAPDLAIPQPIALGAGGVPLYNGSPCTLKIDAEYSVAVVDYLGAQIYYSPRNGDEITAIDDLQSQIDSLEANEQVIINSWSAIASTPVSSAGVIFYLRQHTSGGIGGGALMSFAGSVTDDGVTQKNSATPGFHLKRVGLTVVTPELAGVTNYSANNLASLTAAANAAASLGIPLVGNPLQYYSVSGNFSLPDNLEMLNINVKQLTPAAATRTIVKIGGAGNIRIKNCKVDRNGTADALDPQIGTDAAGVWFQNFNGLYIDDLEVFGNGQGTGIYINNITYGKWNNFYVHDITWWSAVTPVTEKLGGIGILDSSKFTLQNFRIENLYSKTGTDPVRRFQTDGLGIGGNSGCSRFTVCHGFISNVGEGIDITGSGGNTDFKVLDVRAEDCGAASFKFANGNNTGEIAQLTSVRAGQAGIGLVGTGAGVGQLVGNFIIHDCFIYDTGANPEVTGGSVTYDGIQLQEAATQPNAPFNTILSNILIIDRQTVKTMDYGIRRYETVFSGQNIILGDNIIIQGAKVADVAARGVPNTLGKYMFSSMGTGVALNHGTSGTWLAMVLATAEYDDNGLHNSGTFTIKISGLYEVCAQVSFVSNATGNRGIRCKIAKAPAASTIYMSDLRPAVNGDSTFAYIKRQVMLAAGDTITFEYYQSSGAALNTNTVSVYQQVSLIKV